MCTQPGTQLSFFPTGWNKLGVSFVFLLELNLDGYGKNMGYPERTGLSEDTYLLAILPESFHKVYYSLVNAQDLLVVELRTAYSL